MSRKLCFMLAGVALGLLVLALPVGLLVWIAAAPSFDDLKRDGEEMISAIERYRTESGRYPESLEAAGVVPPQCRYGPWRYRLNPDGMSFCLSVGDYSRDGFIFYYSSDRRDWYADT